jgi:DtxR family transcriptional regulator, Mn-dependent transcriptional regulator
MRKWLPDEPPLPHRVLPELSLPLRHHLDRGRLARAIAQGGADVNEIALLGGRSAAAAREEVLEELWTVQEAGTEVTIAELESTIHAGASDGWGGVVQELVEAGLVTIEGGLLRLTPPGTVEASAAVRRHRLAEVLFHQVLDLPMDETENEACRVEHVLTAQATDAVCSFLGHPPQCPHGRPIPPGNCCATLTRRVAPLICRLVDLAPGERGRIVLVAPRHRERLEQLADLGVTPGLVVTLRQHKPSLVLEVDHTLLALEEEVAQGIYLRPLREW